MYLGMNHFNISILKSIIRIVSAVAAIDAAMNGITAVGVIVLCSGFIFAEVLGVLEEIYDKREE